MRLNITSPLETLKLLKEFKETKKVLNEFGQDNNAINFLDSNRNNIHNLRKLEVVLNNFEKNCLFELSDSIKKGIFEYMEKSQCTKKIEESEKYKLYLYFFGVIEYERIIELLKRYSESENETVDFKNYVSRNIDKLFNERRFPRYLNGNYEALKQLVPLIAEDYTIFEKLDCWQENLLGYLYEQNKDIDFLQKVVMSLIYELNHVMYNFLKKNQNIKFKKLRIEFKVENGIRYKVYILELQQHGCLVLYGEFNQEKNKVKRIFCMGNIKFIYVNKYTENFSELIKFGRKIDKIRLVKTFRDIYALNKIYMIGYYFACIKRVFSRNKGE